MLFCLEVFNLIQSCGIGLGQVALLRGEVRIDLLVAYLAHVKPPEDHSKQPVGQNDKEATDGEREIFILEVLVDDDEDERKKHTDAVDEVEKGRFKGFEGATAEEVEDHDEW